MAHLPIIKPDKLAKAVQRNGFIKTRQNGRWTSIPMHRKTVGKGLLRKILNDVKINPEDI